VTEGNISNVVIASQARETVEVKNLKTRPRTFVRDKKGVWGVSLRIPGENSQPPLVQEGGWVYSLVHVQRGVYTHARATLDHRR
jgi:hypothetical protein